MIYACFQSTYDQAKKCALSNLDWDQDGKVSSGDVKETFNKAYTFIFSLKCSDLHNYKLLLFKNAIAYMKDELENDKCVKKSEIDEKVFMQEMENKLSAVMSEFTTMLQTIKQN